MLRPVILHVLAGLELMQSYVEEELTDGVFFGNDLKDRSRQRRYVGACHIHDLPTAHLSCYAACCLF